MNATKKLVLVGIFILGFATNAQSALITFDFEGMFNDTNLLFNSGDTFFGSYTFESTTPVIPHPDPSLDIQALAIDPALLGTGWDLAVNSSVISDFSLSGNLGVIAVGDETAIVGDRYTVTLSNFGGNLPLPGGLFLNFFQIDLIDLTSPGPTDMLSSDDFRSLPDLSAAVSFNSHGRFFALGSTEGCDQCSITLTSLTERAVVPEPSTLFLFGTAILGLAFRRKLS